MKFEVFKRILSLLLCGVMLFGMIPPSALAEEIPEPVTDPTVETTEVPEETIGETEETSEPTEVTEATEETSEPTEATEATEETSEPTEATEATEISDAPNFYSEGTGGTGTGSTNFIRFANDDLIVASVPMTTFTAEYNDAILEDELSTLLDPMSSWAFDIEAVPADSAPTVDLFLELGYFDDYDNIVIYLIRDGELIDDLDYTTEKVSYGDDIYTVQINITLDSGAFTLAVGNPATEEPIPEIPDGAELVSLSVTPPYKNRYFLSQDVQNDGYVYIDIAGIVVTAGYEYEDQYYSRELVWDQYNDEIDGYHITPDDMTTVGVKKVTVSYGGHSGEFYLWVCLDEFTDNEMGVSIAFDSPNVTSVDVRYGTINALATRSLSWFLEGEWVVYDITATYSEYKQQMIGTAMVTVPIPDHVTTPAVYYVSEDGKTIHYVSSTDNGNGTVTFLATHFSDYVVGQGTLIPETENNITASITRWKLVSSPTSGRNYLIANKNSSGDGFVLQRNNEAIAAQAVKISSDNGLYIEDSDTLTAWKATQSGNNWQFQNGDYYLARNNDLLDTNSSNWTLNNNRLYYRASYTGNNQYQYLRFTNNSWSYATGRNTNNASNVYFYEEATTTSTLNYGVSITVNGSPTLDAYTINLSSSDQSLQLGVAATADHSLPAGVEPHWELVDGGMVATVNQDGLVTFTTASGQTVVKVSYTWGENDEYTISNYIVLVVYGAAECEWSMNLETPTFDSNGEVVGTTDITAPIVIKNVASSDRYTNIWAVIKANDNDIGALSPNELQYLTFESLNTSIATVDSNGVVSFTGVSGMVDIRATFTYGYDGEIPLTVSDTVTFSVSDDKYYIPEDGTNDFPQYPEEGSIRFDKTSTAVGNFSETGLTKVELSMTGVPYTTSTPTDVVIMVDMTKSMNNNGVNRVPAAKNALKALINTLVYNENNGTYNTNIRLYITSFGSGYSQESNAGSVAQFKEVWTGEPITNATLLASLTGDGGEIDKLAAYTGNNYGTTYLASMQRIWNTLSTSDAKQRFAIFLTDGAASDFAVWQEGDDETFKVEYSTTDYGKYDFSGWFNGNELGANYKTEFYSYKLKKANIPLYTVGVSITEGSNEAKMISRMSSDYSANGRTRLTASDEYYFSCDANKPLTEESLKKFRNIGMSIREAAKDVKVEDKIGGDFTMVFEIPNADISSSLDGKNQEFYIEVGEYVLTADPNNPGDTIRGAFTSKAKMYLGKNGNEYFAASDANGTTNYPAPIFEQRAIGSMYYWTTTPTTSGIYYPKNNPVYYFSLEGISEDSEGFVAQDWYNLTSGGFATGTTSTHSYTVPGSSTPKESKYSDDLVIATPYFVYNAATATLVWTADKLTEKELTLSYFLYLAKSGGYSGSADEKDPGTYPTNKYASLTYSNFQEQPCEQYMPVPQVTWHGAQVSYVFYLVNSQGQPVNRSGQVVPFSEAVYVTDVFTTAVTWAGLEQEVGLEANRVANNLKDPNFQLYDQNAKYTIHVYADEDQVNLNNHFKIEGTQGKNLTTYVFNTKETQENLLII